MTQFKERLDALNSIYRDAEELLTALFCLTATGLNDDGESGLTWERSRCGDGPFRIHIDGSVAAESPVEDRIKHAQDVPKLVEKAKLAMDEALRKAGV